MSEVPLQVQAIDERRLAAEARAAEVPILPLQIHHLHHMYRKYDNPAHPHHRKQTGALAEERATEAAAAMEKVALDPKPQTLNPKP